MLVWSELQGETKILKLKNLRPQDYANYSCIASVRNVCGIPDRSVIFKLTNKTGTLRLLTSLNDTFMGKFTAFDHVLMRFQFENSKFNKCDLITVGQALEKNRRNLCSIFHGPIFLLS